MYLLNIIFHFKQINSLKRTTGAETLMLVAHDAEFGMINVCSAVSSERLGRYIDTNPQIRTLFHAAVIGKKII